MQPQGDRGRGDQEGGLEAFLTGFDRLVGLFGERAAVFAQDADSEPLARHYTDVLREQIGSISPALLDAYRQSNDSVRREADELLRVSAAPSLVSGAASLLPQIGSLVGLSSLAAIFELIKKILGLLVEVLHVRFLDRWWKFISDVIDEIIEALTRLFSKTGARELHRQQVAYLETQFHLTRWDLLRRDPTGELDQPA